MYLACFGTAHAGYVEYAGKKLLRVTDESRCGLLMRVVVAVRDRARVVEVAVSVNAVIGWFARMRQYSSTLT